MNKILFLKGLIAVLTLLIFLALGGIVYALINYKTTPKLLPRDAAKEKPAAVVALTQSKSATLKDAVACGKHLCVAVSDAIEGDKIAVFDTDGRKVAYWIAIRE